MKKILYIVSTLKRSGPTNQLYNLIKYLDRKQYKPHILTLSIEPKDSRYFDFLQLGIKIQSIGLSRIKGILLGQYRINKLIKLLNPDILHSQGIRSDMLIANTNGLNPKITTIRNYPQFDYKMTYGYLPGYIMTLKHSAALKKMTCCIGVSVAVCKNLKDSLGLQNTYTILNGIDVDYFSPIPENNKIIIRKKLKLPEMSCIWISIGHLSKLKDPLFIIEFWKKHFRFDPHNYLVLLGHGELYEACLKASGGYNIKIIGYTTNVKEYLQASNYFISASKSEGMPNVVLEALACGLPVLLSNILPHKEILRLNEKAGELFELNSEISFLKALGNIINTNYWKLSNNAFSLVKEHFDAEIMSNKYQEVYNRLIET